MRQPLRRGTTSPSRFGQTCSPPPLHSASNAASVTERQIRFTEQFFDQLDLLLPSERGADGTPSITDFLLIDLPRVRDQPAIDVP